MGRGVRQPRAGGGGSPVPAPPPPPTYPQGREPGWPRAGFLRSAVGKTLLRAAPRSRAVPRSGGRPRRRPPLPCPRGWGGGGVGTHTTRVGEPWVGAGRAAKPVTRGGAAGTWRRRAAAPPFVVIPSAGGALPSPNPPPASLGWGGLGWGFGLFVVCGVFFSFFFPSSPPSSCRQSGSVVKSFRLSRTE